MERESDKLVTFLKNSEDKFLPPNGQKICAKILEKALVALRFYATESFFLKVGDPNQIVGDRNVTHGSEHAVRILQEIEKIVEESK